MPSRAFSAIKSDSEWYLKNRATVDSRMCAGCEFNAAALTYRRGSALGTITQSSRRWFMRIELYGLGFETPAVFFYLWSPWRASLLETRLFDLVAKASGNQVEKRGDEVRVQISDVKAWRQVVQSVARVMKGWEEEG